MTTGISQVSGPQGPSYGALKEDLNLTPQEAAQKAKQSAQNTWVGGVADSVAPKNMTFKKAALSIALTSLLVFGVSLLGKNTKMFKKLGDLGDEISNKLKLGNPDGKFAKLSENIKKWVKKDGTLRGKIVKNIQEIFKKNPDGVKENLLRSKAGITQTMVRGTNYEVVDNVTDQLQTALKGAKVEVSDHWLFSPISRATRPVRQFWKNLMEGPGFFKDRGFFKNLSTAESAKFKAGNVRKFKDMLAKNGCSTKEIKSLCKEISELGGDVDQKFAVYSKIKKYLKPEDIKGATELFTGRVHGFKVGFFDSIRRAEMIGNRGDGKALYGAKSGLGRILQKIFFRTMEAPSNGVASRNIMSTAIALPIAWGVSNKVYEAPKGEKGKKFAEEIVRDAGNYMLIPTVVGTMYGGASLFKYFGLSSNQIQSYKNLLKNGKFEAAKKIMSSGTKWEKALRIPGKILGMGLEGKPNKLKGLVGGAGRLWLYMMVLSPLFIKPVVGLCHKIFGKPSDTKAEEDRIKQEKIDKKQTKANQAAFDKKLRELGLTQEDLANALTQRPDIIQRLQSDQQLVQNLEKNPLVLFDLLASPPQAVAPQAVAPEAQGGMTLSPSMVQRLTQSGIQSPAAPANAVTPEAPMNAPEMIPAADPAYPARTYIPSSAPVVQGTNLTPDQRVKLDRVSANADKAEAEAVKYL